MASEPVIVQVRTADLHFDKRNPRLSEFGIDPKTSDDADVMQVLWDAMDVKELIQEWVDRELDHRMILKKGDPLVKALKDLKEPVYEMDANPTAESLAELIWRYAKSKGLPVTNVTFWETPSSNASFGG